QGRRQVRSLQCLAIAVMSGSDLQRRLNEALREVERVRTENERLRTLLALAQQTKTDPRVQQAGTAARERLLSGVGGREGRARATVVPRPRRRVRASLGERTHRKERLHAGDGGRLESAGSEDLSAVGR